REVDLLLFLVPFVHREVDDPAELEAILRDQVEILTDLGAHRTRELHEHIGIAGNKEDGVASLEAERRAQLLGALRSDIVGDRAAAERLPALLDKEDVAEPGLPLALRPGIHAVAECARAAAWRRDRPYLVLRAGLENAREHLEAGAAENL